MASSPEELSFREALSGISGSISLVSWMVILLPQLLENYKNGNAEGLSTLFLIAWMLGDTANLIGAIWGKLLPTVIALGIYFCFADAVLLSQTIYYNHLTKIDENKDPENDPSRPLIADGTRRRSSAASHSSRRRRSVVHRKDSFSAYLLKERSRKSVIIRNTLSILAVCAAGAAGWFVAWKTGAWSATPPNGSDSKMPFGAQVLGYVSAILYLTARLPQIWQNYKKKSCEGLSILFFMLSMLGNLSYAAGILFHSTEKSYVWDNLPWLLGSAGTVFEDALIFCQFKWYQKKHRRRMHRHHESAIEED